MKDKKVSPDLVTTLCAVVEGLVGLLLISNSQWEFLDQDMTQTLMTIFVGARTTGGYYTNKPEPISPDEVEGEGHDANVR